MSVVIPDGKTAAALETLAREKAVTDFLSEVRLSLEVWGIDPDVQAYCEHVITWLRRVVADLAALGDPATPSESRGDGNA